MKQQILESLNTLSEEEQNVLMEEIVKSLKQQRLQKSMELSKEARRIEWSLKGL
jgi:FixJ family two-component response regulator